MWKDTSCRCLPIILFLMLFQNSFTNIKTLALNYYLNISMEIGVMDRLSWSMGFKVMGALSHPDPKISVCLYQTEQYPASNIERKTLFTGMLLKITYSSFLIFLDITVFGNWCCWTNNRNVRRWIFLSMDKCNCAYLHFLIEWKLMSVLLSASLRFSAAVI